MVDPSLIHVEDEVGMTGTVRKSRANVLKKIESLSLNFARVALRLVCGNTMCKSMFCQEAGEADLDSYITPTLNDFVFQLTSLSEKSESIDIESFLAPLLDEVQKVPFDIGEHTKMPLVMRHLVALLGDCEELIFLLSPTRNAGLVDLENIGSLGLSHPFLHHELVKYSEDSQLLGVGVPVTVNGPTGIMPIEVTFGIESSWVV